MKYIISLLFLFIIGCEDKIPSQKDVASLYVDILVAEETYKTMSDSLQISLDSLYNYHAISDSQYLTAIKKYKFDEETWNEFFSLAEEYLDTLKAVEKRNTKKK